LKGSAMEVILSKDVEKIGKAGAVLKVKDGFARNFLLPRGLAVPVTEANLKRLEEQKRRRLLEQENTKAKAQELKGRLDGLALTIPVLTQEENDSLYGSITAFEVAKAIQDEGIQIDKNCILLEEPIKSLGIYEVPIKLHPDVPAKIKVWIVKK